VNAHGAIAIGQASGHPYITHPAAVATILAGLEEAGEVEDRMLCAAVLHDAVEDRLDPGVGDPPRHWRVQLHMVRQ
jgi:(p)ppGpp synthase/HD superfamily hydrolase